MRNIIRTRDWCKFCNESEPCNGVLFDDVFVCDECITNLCEYEHEDPVGEENKDTTTVE